MVPDCSRDQHYNTHQTTMNYQDIYYTLKALSEEIEEGNTNPLTAYTELKVLSEMIGSMMDSVKDQAIEERRKYGKEEVIKNGFKIEIANGRKVWAYKHSTRWQQLDAQRKTYEELMQKAYHGANIADADTGEMIEAAELTFASDTLRLTKTTQQ
jgi:hypothetical protein